MSERKDIIDGSEVSPVTRSGLIYTCKCGWIDLGHANPYSGDPTQGARNLWRNIKDETGSRSPNDLWHKVTLKMSMTKAGVEFKVEQDFAVRRGLENPAKESVALAIFRSMSVDFEKLQGSGQFAWKSDSSFSAEDLMSNLIGFYRAVRPGGTQFIKQCDPVSKDAAVDVWDTYRGVGRHKVREFRPMLFPCRECTGDDHRLAKGLGTVPLFLNDIRPAEYGTNYRLWKEDDPQLTDTPAAAAPPVGATKKAPPVKAGQSLSMIAGDLYGSVELWPLLWDQNKAMIPNPNRIKPGMVLQYKELSEFTPAQIADAKKRSPTWKDYPHP
jgi:hypothetical protein